MNLRFEVQYMAVNVISNLNPLSISYEYPPSTKFVTWTVCLV